MKTSNKIIIGLVGEIASGKDTVADYLKKKYRSETVSFSQSLREILKIIALSESRTNLAKLGQILRKTFGQDILAKAVSRKVAASSKKIVCLPNVRLPQDIKTFKKNPNFFLIAIFAKSKTRWQRLTKRNQNSDDQTKTWNQFLKDGRLPTEKQIRKIASQAEFQIDNNGNFNQLYRQVSEIVRKITEFKNV